MAGKEETPSAEHPDPIEERAVEEAVQEEEGGENQALAAEAEEPATRPASEGPEERAAMLETQLLRLQADFENFRKRTRREKEEWTQRSIERVVEDLLTVLDHFELGLSNAEQHEVQDAVLQGFRMVQDQMVSALGKYGLKAIDAVGEAFDPNLHEAVTHMPSTDAPADHVFAQTRRGYLLGDKLLRPTQVVVSSGAPDSTAPDDDEEGC